MIKESSSPLNAAVGQLKIHWDQLHDLDRARAVAKIRQSGISIRQIAKQLGRGESGLRHLLLALQAPAADLIAARQGKLSTNQLVRSAKAYASRRSARRREAEKRERERKSVEGSKLICDWLSQHNYSGSYGAQIIVEAQRKEAFEELTGPLPRPNVPAGLSTAEIIERRRPKEPLDDLINEIGWYADWLYRWALFVFPDSVVRDGAMTKAEKQQMHRKGATAVSSVPSVYRGARIY